MKSTYKLGVNILMTLIVSNAVHELSMLIYGTTVTCS
jgi:hypothetical protein